MKRVVDIFIASMLLVLTLPVMLAAAIVTTASLRSWPFFTQDRIGKDGRRFRFVKLRTLPTHAPRYAGKYELVDLRLPWFSRLMRRIHLDELPQLILVLTGKMSLVGPRPEMPYLHEEMDEAFAQTRTSVRPGCTGLWQISIDCGSMIHENPQYDEFYVGNQSLRLDVWILWRTVRMLLPFGSDRTVSLYGLPSWLDAATEQASPPALSRSSVSSESVLQTVDG